MGYRDEIDIILDEDIDNECKKVGVEKVLNQIEYQINEILQYVEKFEDIEIRDLCDVMDSVRDGLRNLSEEIY